jgi:Icc-related predicted phosphoesterase
MATIRIGAVGDLHYGRESRDTLKQVFQTIDRERPDLMLLLGDLTDYGTVEEAQGLARELRTNVSVPTLAVLGNHDFEGGVSDAIRATLREGGLTVLDGDSCEVKGIGFAGVKGFCGGFGRGALGPWGEDVIKQFVNAAVQEALKLESALARLRTSVRIVLLHYAPIIETVVGEPPEIYAFMGSSRLEEPLGRLGVTAIFHGHAHKGQAEGRTATGTPVYNVSLPLMSRLTPERPIRIFEVDVAPASDQNVT